MKMYCVYNDKLGEYETSTRCLYTGAAEFFLHKQSAIDFVVFREEDREKRHRVLSDKEAERFIRQVDLIEQKPGGDEAKKIREELTRLSGLVDAAESLRTVREKELAASRKKLDDAIFNFNDNLRGDHDDEKIDKG